MKFLTSSICAVPLILLSMYTYASPVYEQVPLMNKPIPKDGLVIQFDTMGNQRVVCGLVNIYKAVVEYVGSESKYTYVAGNSDQFYLTNAEETKQLSENLTQIHVDKKGVIKIEDPYNKETGTVSCFYLPETTIAK